MSNLFPNPFRPGAGHPPPYLAGREKERGEFFGHLSPPPILANVVLTGLRGVGKTVLLETFKPEAVRRGWVWVGTDLSESASVSEESISVRLLADLSPLVSHVVISEQVRFSIGFTGAQSSDKQYLDYSFLKQVFDTTPGLASDKLKRVLELIWKVLDSAGDSKSGVILAYDEAQNLTDQAGAQQYPLSLLLDVFQSLQKQGYPYLLVLAGLPTLFPKLVEARTFSERMFHIITLTRLDTNESRDAILKPIADQACQVRFTDSAVEEIVKHSGGYPYFIQFLCREIFDSYLQQIGANAAPRVSVSEVVRKLDTDFFSGRWHRASERQRDVLRVIASLPNCDEEFTVQDVAQKSATLLDKPLSPSHVTQLFTKLSDNGLVYKNRHGRYSFAVPLLGSFIRRQQEQGYL